MIKKFGKPFDFQNLNRNLSWRKTLSAEQGKLAARAFVDQGPRLKICPICSANESSHFGQIYGFDFVECNDCTHLFISNQPSSAAIEAMYAGTEDEKCVQKHVYMDEGLYQKRVSLIAEPKVNFVNEIFDSEKKGLWIDVGCATGELLKAASATGWDGLGYETDSAEVELALKMGVRVKKEYLTPDKDFQELQSARVVSFLNIVEHILDPVTWLKTLLAPLKSGSYVIIEVPRHPSISSFVNIAFPKMVYRHLSAPMHLHIFTDKSMEILLEHAGLSPVAGWYFGQDFQELISVTAVSQGLEESKFLSQILRANNKVQEAIDESGLSDVMFVITRKK